MNAGIAMLRQRYHHNPQWFRSQSICFVDGWFSTTWVGKYDDFKLITPDEEGGGRMLPAGAFNYYKGDLPEFCKSGKTWGYDITDIYCPLHILKDHWVALWISIPNRYITVWDCFIRHANEKEIEERVEPIAVMLPNLLRDACAVEDRHKFSRERYTHERIKKGIVQNPQVGDCGVYSLKYIELHALGTSFSPPSALCDKNIPWIREKLASEMYDEIKYDGSQGQDYTGLDLYEKN